MDDLRLNRHLRWIVTERADTGRTDAITRRLLAFFDERRRDLPWRRAAEPYRVWISEVMLQQTRVETVLPYYERWLCRFPDLARLAAAPLDDVLHEWQGLGYYSRARNLHAAARAVCERHGGRLPDSVEALRALPGIGEYTAGAVASIAFGRAEPAIDGNARRVLSRLFDLARPTAATLRKHARTLVPRDRPGDFNQAVMELGATLCAPRNPRCKRCPVRDACLARIRGTVARRPPPRARTAVPRFDIGTAAIVAPGARLLLVRRPGSGLLAGLWSLPGAGTGTRESVRAAAARAGRLAGVRTRAREARFLGAVEHAFSHRHETYHVHRFDAHPDSEPGPDRDRIWADARTRDALALPAGQRRILRLVFP
jgi:A/G-specific adenine glycosylase